MEPWAGYCIQGFKMSAHGVGYTVIKTMAHVPDLPDSIASQSNAAESKTHTSLRKYLRVYTNMWVYVCIYMHAYTRKYSYMYVYTYRHEKGRRHRNCLQIPRLTSASRSRSARWPSRIPGMRSLTTLSFSTSSLQPGARNRGSTLSQRQVKYEGPPI